MLFEAFRTMRREHGGEPAFLVAAGDRSIAISWREFTDDIAAVSFGIKKNCPGGVIALLGENSYEWMVAHAATVFSGAVVLPLDLNLSAQEIAARLSKTGAKVLVHSALHSEKAQKVKSLAPKTLVVGFGSAESDDFISAAKHALDGDAANLFDLEPPDVNRVSMIAFTSGTTSEPRGAELTLAGLECFAVTAAERMALSSRSRTLMLLPVFHIFGIAVTYASLAAGVALGVCPDYRRIYDAVVRFKADFLFLVPALADILASKIARRGRRVSDIPGFALEWICTGGAPVSPVTHEKLVSLGIGMYAAYGLTETTASYSMSDMREKTPCGYAGKVYTYPGTETKVSETGELLIRGACVFKGYYKDKVRTAEALDEDGWFHTGDTGEIDENGMVRVTGRISRTIVLSSGKKIAPEELENRISMYPGVKEVLVYGDGESREITAEVYASCPGGDVHEAISAMNRTLPVYMRVKRVVVRREPFERTASGKIALPRSKTKRRISFDWKSRLVAGVGFLALGVFVFDFVLDELLPCDIAKSGFLGTLRSWTDGVGDVLVAVFAFSLLFKVWSMRKKGRRK